MAWKLQKYPSRFQIRIDAKKADIKTDSEIILQFNCKKEDTGKNQFTVSVTWNCNVIALEIAHEIAL